MPIVLDGNVLGAIGVSGNTPQEDEDIARAGAAAFPVGNSCGALGSLFSSLDAPERRSDETPGATAASNP